MPLHYQDPLECDYRSGEIGFEELRDLTLEPFEFGAPTESTGATSGVVDDPASRQISRNMHHLSVHGMVEELPGIVNVSSSNSGIPLEEGFIRVDQLGFFETLDLTRQEQDASEIARFETSWSTQLDFEADMFELVSSSKRFPNAMPNINADGQTVRCDTVEKKRLAAASLWASDPETYVLQFSHILDDRYLARIFRDHMNQPAGLHARKIISLRRKYTPAQTSPERPSNTCAKNRRHIKLTQLLHEGSFFSDESIRERDRFLFHEHLGRYFGEPAPTERKVGAPAPLDAADGGFLLGDALEEVSSCLRSHEKVAQRPGPPHMGAPRVPRLAPADVELRRAELVRAASERFLLGLDGEWVDYRSIDTDEGLDQSSERDRDTEERYFDY
jgi:hypothetical protein